MKLYYQDATGDVVLYCGDCVDILPLVVRRGMADAVVTDPPYVIPSMMASGRGIVRSIGDLSLIERGFRIHAGMWKAVLGDTGRIMVFCGGSGTSYSVIYRAAYEHFHLAGLVWDRCRVGLGHEYRKQHELILHGWGSKTPKAAASGHGDILRVPSVTKTQREHPAQKPIPLLKELLRVCGDVIVDPFMGSGSTGIAARSMGKRFIGIEIEERYCEIAAKRLQKLR
jgi:site-specific DNA-methyltransferase (adenine-specific)